MNFFSRMSLLCFSFSSETRKTKREKGFGRFWLPWEERKFRDNNKLKFAIGHRVAQDRQSLEVIYTSNCRIIAAASGLVFTNPFKYKKIQPPKHGLLAEPQPVDLSVTILRSYVLEILPRLNPFVRYYRLVFCSFFVNFLISRLA